MKIQRIIKSLVRKLGYDILPYEFYEQRWGNDIMRYGYNNTFPVDFSKEDIEKPFVLFNHTPEQARKESTR